MAKRKKVNKFYAALMWLVGLVVLIGVGGLFWTGFFLTVPVLEWLPSVVHKIVAGLIWLSGLVYVVHAFKK